MKTNFEGAALLVVALIVGLLSINIVASEGALSGPLFPPLYQDTTPEQRVETIKASGQMDQVIALLVTSGEICSRYGHWWKKGSLPDGWWFSSWSDSWVRTCRSCEHKERK
jgi:hypothetical protein